MRLENAGLLATVKCPSSIAQKSPVGTEKAQHARGMNLVEGSR